MSDRDLAEWPLDAAPWRRAERAAQLGRTARRAWKRWRGARASEPRHPIARALIALGPEPKPPDAAWQVRALRLTLQGGAYPRAAAHAAWLLDRLDRLPPELRRDALPPALELLTAIGEDARARALAERYRHDLAVSDVGATRLSALGLGGDALVLPGGGLDALAIARRIEDGALDGAAVRRLLLAHPRALLGNPQLHLLVASAERSRDRAAAVRALDRFLRVHGGPAAELRGSSGDFLRDVRFVAGPKVWTGPRVSVLVAAYRATATLAYAIDSLLAQTYQHLEILICDDASDDDTRARLVARYAAEPKVRLFASARNQGPYNLRNRLLAEARGELVTFHDADDVALPDRIAAQVREVERGAVACMTTLVRVTRDGRFVFFRDQAAVRLCMVSQLCRRELLDEVGGFRPTRFGADHDLYERLRERFGDERIAVIRRPLVIGLWSAGSLTRQAGAEAFEDGFRAPARRRYTELLFTRATAGLDDAVLERELRALGNWAEAQPITEL